MKVKLKILPKDTFKAALECCTHCYFFNPKTICDSRKTAVFKKLNGLYFMECIDHPSSYFVISEINENIKTI